MKVGSKIVLIYDDWYTDHPLHGMVQLPVKGVTYTVRNFCEEPGCEDSIRLEEIINPIFTWYNTDTDELLTGEVAFFQFRFREPEELYEEISSESSISLHELAPLEI